jgi:hypothetical protein
VAFTGADFLQTGAEFGSGYTWGMTEAMMMVVDQNNPKELKRRQCLMDSHLDASAMYHLVQSYVEEHPKQLVEPLVSAVYRAVDEMCSL